MHLRVVLRTWSSGKQAAASAVVHPKPFVPPPSSLLAPSLSPLFVCPLSPPLPCLSSSLLLILSPGVAIPHEFAGANSAHSWGFAGLFTGQGREQEDGPRSTPGAQHRTQRHQSEMITAIVLEHSPCFVHGRTLSPPRCSSTHKGISPWQQWQQWQQNDRERQRREESSSIHFAATQPDSTRFIPRGPQVNRNYGTSQAQGIRSMPVRPGQEKSSEKAVAQTLPLPCVSRKWPSKALLWGLRVFKVLGRNVI